MKLLTAFSTHFSTFLHIGVGHDDPCVFIPAWDNLCFYDFYLEDILHTVLFDKQSITTKSK